MSVGSPHFPGQSEARLCRGLLPTAPHEKLERQGRSIGGCEVRIAGHARSRALIVVTGDRGEFDRVDGLMCEDWG